MPKKHTQYGPKAEFLDFFPSDTTRENLADMWGREHRLADFFRDQKGVTGKLKYWEFRCVHFPAIDKFLNKAAKDAYAEAKTVAEKQKLANEHPTVEILTTKPGTQELVWPVWYVSTREISDEDIITGPIAIMNINDEGTYWWELEHSLDTEKIFAGPLLGLTKLVEKPLPGANESDLFHSQQLFEQTTKGKKLFHTFRSMPGRQVHPAPSTLADCADYWHVVAIDLPSSVVTDDVYEIINHYHLVCQLVDSFDRFEDGSYLQSYNDLTEYHDRDDWLNRTTLKNYRMPWTHARALEETADFIGTNSTEVVHSLIAKHCADLVLSKLRNSFAKDDLAMKKTRPRFEAWRDALKAFRNIGFKIPETLEEVSELAKADEDKRRAGQEEKALTALTAQVERMSYDLGDLVKLRKLKDQAIDGGHYGEQGGGSVVLTGKQGFNVRRVTSLDYMAWESTHRRISSVINASVHGANPFLFRGIKPDVVRVGQAKQTQERGADISLFVEDFAGYKIKATKEENVADIVEEFNKALAKHFNYPTEPMIAWPEDKITLTKDWVDYANQWPADKLNENQGYVIPDPRSLPDGSPPQSQFPMTTD